MICKYKDDTRCSLLVVDPNSLKMLDAAIGSAFGSDGKATVRGKKIKPEHMKVRVQIVLEEMKKAPLPVPIPKNEIMLLVDAEGSFVEWPIKSVIFSADQEIGKMRPLEAKGSNSNLTKESTPKRRKQSMTS